MQDSYPSTDHGNNTSVAGSVKRYSAVAAVFGALAVVLAVGWAEWAPTTWIDWLMVIGLTPAGVAGVLIGDRFGLWLKDQGIGRQ